MNNKVALVTGASSGIGAATAKALVKNGWITYGTARQTNPTDPSNNEGVILLPLDVTDEDSMVRAVRQIEGTHKAVDLLVNNAGFGLPGPVEELAVADIRRQFETNVFGLVRMCQLVLPAMRHKESGRIINVGSVGGTFTTPGSGAYHASKWAVESFTDALRMEVAAFGVDVVLIQPPGVYTEFDKRMRQALPDADPRSPYAAFKANHARITEAMFTGKNTAGIIAASDVALVITRAATVPHPHTRYKVGWSAHVYSFLRRMLSDRAWDKLMAQQFPMSAK